MLLAQCYEVSALVHIVKEKVNPWTSRDNRAFESIYFQWVELVKVNIECREYIGISRREELKENLMTRLGASVRVP